MGCTPLEEGLHPGSSCAALSLCQVSSVRDFDPLWHPANIASTAFYGDHGWTQPNPTQPKHWINTARNSTGSSSDEADSGSGEADCGGGEDNEW